MPSTERGYQGWRDHATWAMALHLGNDEGLYRHWREVARQALRDHPDDPDRARWAVEDALREWWDATVEEQFKGATGEPGLLFRDIIPTGDAIDWRAVAEAIMEGAEE